LLIFFNDFWLVHDNLQLVLFLSQKQRKLRGKQQELLLNKLKKTKWLNFQNLNFLSRT